MINDNRISTIKSSESGAPFGGARAAGGGSGGVREAVFNEGEGETVIIKTYSRNDSLTRSFNHH